MTQYNLDELKMLNQFLFALFIVADFALALYFYNNSFPWFTLLGAGIGLAIIVLCWTGKKYLLFISFLVAFTAIYSVIFNWSSIVH